jgi:glutaminase
MFIATFTTIAATPFQKTSRRNQMVNSGPLLVHAEVEGDRQNERRRHTVQDEG